MNEDYHPFDDLSEKEVMAIAQDIQSRHEKIVRDLADDIGYGNLYNLAKKIYFEKCDERPSDKFISLAKQAIKIFESAADWKTKYELIFSDEISVAINSLCFELDYYDPDTSYQEDVTAFVEAVRAKMNEFLKAKGESN